MKILVTGARGFVGRNLCVALRLRSDVDLTEIDVDSSPEELERALGESDVIVHLAGVNRSEQIEDFAAGNAALTGELLRTLERGGRKPKVVLSSSIQAERDNPYGVSKRRAEEELQRFCEANGSDGVAFRLKNLFGKWCRPNYNSVVATFCDAIARGQPIQISDPANSIDLTYIDDVVAAFVAELDAPPTPHFRFAEPLVSHRITLGELADSLRSFRAHRETLLLPDFSSRFVEALYATYLSYVPPEEHGYALHVRTDERGNLAEFLKSPHFGQIFISRTKPGITRGNHYHHTKTEKFMVVGGEGLIRMRKLGTDAIVEFRVRGEDYRVVDIPPGYTHSIENVGKGEMVTLFWSSEVFDPKRPDTFRDLVLPEDDAR